MRCIDWADGAVRLIDQTALPAEERWLEITDPDALVDAIRRLVVRGDAGDTVSSPRGRIRGTQRLLTAAAVIMSVFLLTSSLVTTLLIPPAEFEDGGAANGRALAYLAHEYLGNAVGTNSALTYTERLDDYDEGAPHLSRALGNSENVGVASFNGTTVSFNVAAVAAVFDQRADDEIGRVGRAVPAPPGLVEQSGVPIAGVDALLRGSGLTGDGDRKAAEDRCGRAERIVRRLVEALTHDGERLRVDVRRLGRRR